MSEENEGIIAKATKIIEQNWRLLLVGVIILAIALNSSQTGKESSENKSETSPAAQTEESNQNKSEEKTQTTENNSASAAQIKETDTTTTSTNANVIVQTAAKSEGVTHLARRAVKEYLSANQETLSAEQKIYAEDYLKKKTGTRALKVGEKMEFSTELVKQSVEQSKLLTEKQIENLSKYVPLVKNLN